MVNFKTVTLCDKDWIDAIAKVENSPSANYNFNNIYIWDKAYRQLVCNYHGRMLTMLRYGEKPAFVFPIGSGELRPAIEALRRYAADRGYCFVLRGLTENHRQALEKEYPGRFEYTEDVDSYDYIYRAEKLATYSGKSLHSKKNHCNRFEAENNWSFVPLTRELIPGCLDMLDVWYESNTHRLESSIDKEHDAIIRAFAAFEQLGFDGGVLLVDDKIVGFTLGSMANEDTVDVHFEKAEVGINGAYPMVCREFVRMLMAKYPNLKYINREDDMGIESLRRSKQSYKPEFMLKKYIARWIYG